MLAYLAAGAEEVWIIDEEGAWYVFNAAGEQSGTKFSVELPDLLGHL